MVIFGTCCLLYYVVLRIATKKWNSTFAGFWLGLGVLSMVIRMFLVSNPEWNREIPWIVVFVGFGLFALVELLILSHMFPRKTRAVSVLIVLGAQIQGRKITDSLMRRLDLAYDYLKAHPETNVIVSGGQGTGEEVTEAEAMEGFLVVRGIGRDRILRESRSTSTKENMEFSIQMFSDPGQPVGIVTNNFHMFRAMSYARRAGFKNICPFPADCSAVFLINYLVREFFAVIKMVLFP